METINDSIRTFVLVNFESDSAFKERDDILRNAFNELKRRKIYIDDEEETIYYDF